MLPLALCNLEASLEDTLLMVLIPVTALILLVSFPDMSDHPVA